MRTLHITSSLDPKAGGVSQAVRTIIKGLNLLGIDNEVICTDSANADYLTNESFKIYALGPGKSAWKFTPDLLRWLTTNVALYDAVVIHGLWQYQTYAVYKAWTAINGKRPKLLVMPHGMLDPYFQHAKGRKLKAIRNVFFWKWNEGRLVNNADALLFTCEMEKVLAKEPFKPYHPKSEIVVGLGVESPPSYTDDMRVAFEKLIGNKIKNYWLFISRIHEKKGVNLLINAYQVLQKQNVDLPDLVIAGPGLDEAYGKEMLELTKGNKSIYFPGMLIGRAKWGAFYGADTFILPSHQENFGIAVVEAMACAKPVLISDQVNIWSEIKRGNGGIISSDTEEGTLVLLKSWLSLSAEEKNEMGKNARKTFDTHFMAETASRALKKALEVER